MIEKKNNIFLLVLVSFVAIICAMGWIASSKDEDVISSEVSMSSEAEDYESKIDEYRTSLSQANEHINDVNECVNNAESSVDDGPDAMLDELCTTETVDDPF